MAKIILNLTSSKDEEVTIEFNLESKHLLEERDNALLNALGSLVSRFENASVNGKEYTYLTADFVVGDYFIYTGDSDILTNEIEEDNEIDGSIRLKT